MTLTAIRSPRIADELGDLAVRMSTLLLDDHTGGSAAQILTSLAVNAVPSASGAGVTLVGNRGVKTSVAATSDAVLEADALQYHLNQGPCLDAYLQAAPVQIDDLALDHRWPAWTKAERPLNIASLMSIRSWTPDGFWERSRSTARCPGPSTNGQHFCSANSPTPLRVC